MSEQLGRAKAVEPALLDESHHHWVVQDLGRAVYHSIRNYRRGT